MCAPGTVFRPNTEPDFHRWVIISMEYRGRVLMVNITDREKLRDHSCLIDVGEHDSITKPSAVFYKKAMAMPAKGVSEALAKGEGITIYNPCGDALLRRIVESAKRSHISEPMLEYLLKASPFAE
jgi:hypothetical protein